MLSTRYLVLADHCNAGANIGGEKSCLKPVSEANDTSLRRDLLNEL